VVSQEFVSYIARRILRFYDAYQISVFGEISCYPDWSRRTLSLHYDLIEPNPETSWTSGYGDNILESYLPRMAEVEPALKTILENFYADRYRSGDAGHEGEIIESDIESNGYVQNEVCRRIQLIGQKEDINTERGTTANNNGQVNPDNPKVVPEHR
jgi:hypothetical protein